MQIRITSNMLAQQTGNEEKNECIGDNPGGRAICEYDHFLEKLKFEIKKVFRDDWNSCVWIKDEQSEALCSLLYPCIFRAENRVRAFANKLLIWELGPNWISSPGLEKYAESHQILSEVFRRKEPSFADVDDVFISTTLETLFEIIQHGVVYEDLFDLSRDLYNQLLVILSKGKQQNAIDWLHKQRKVKKNLWEDIFKAYFAGTENAQQIITDFILNRNHIAHHKPISYNAYRIMKDSISDFDNMVEQANAQFEASELSEEDELTIEILNDQMYEEQEYTKNYLRDRIYGETGIEIRWHDEIFELLAEKCEQVYQAIRDKYYWDNRFTIGSKVTPKDDEGWAMLFTVKCNACQEYRLEVQVLFDVNEEMNDDSYLYLRVVIFEEDKEIGNEDGDEGKEKHRCYVIHYHNGSASENYDEGTITPESDSYLDNEDESLFLEELDELVESLNPYIARKDALEILAATEGSAPPVAEFPCWECDRFGVSISEDFYKYGHCCYCGSDNEVRVCTRCGTPFGDGGGAGELCNACIEYIENE